MHTENPVIHLGISHRIALQNQEAEQSAQKKKAKNYIGLGGSKKQGIHCLKLIIIFLKKGEVKVSLVDGVVRSVSTKLKIE